MKILVLEPMDESGPRWLRSQGHEVILSHEGKSWSDAGSDVDAIIVRGMRVDNRMLDRLPKLRAIGKHGVGVENIDFSAVQSRNIPVTFTPGAAANAVAEHGVALLFAACREVVVSDRAVRENAFEHRYQTRIKELSGTRLGILGCGRIGTRVGEICRSGLGVQVGVFDPYVREESVQQLDAVTFAGVEEFFDWADNVVVTAPLTPETAGLVGPRELGLLGSNGVIVAVGRGGIVDEIALAEAAERGTIWGAGLDVFSPEPPERSNPLLRCARVVLSPHLAGISDQAMRTMSQEVCRNVIAVLNDEDAPLIDEKSMTIVHKAPSRDGT